MHPRSPLRWRRPRTQPRSFTPLLPLLLPEPPATPRTAQHSTAQHSTAQHSTAQHSTAQHSTAQHSTAQHSTAQHSTAHNAMHNPTTGCLSMPPTRQDCPICRVWSRSNFSVLAVRLDSREPSLSLSSRLDRQHSSLSCFRLFSGYCLFHFRLSFFSAFSFFGLYFFVV